MTEISNFQENTLRDCKHHIPNIDFIQNEPYFKKKPQYLVGS